MSANAAQVRTAHDTRMLLRTRKMAVLALETKLSEAALYNLIREPSKVRDRAIKAIHDVYCADVIRPLPLTAWAINELVKLRWELVSGTSREFLNYFDEELPLWEYVYEASTEPAKKLSATFVLAEAKFAAFAVKPDRERREIGTDAVALHEEAFDLGTERQLLSPDLSRLIQIHLGGGFYNVYQDDIDNPEILQKVRANFRKTFYPELVREFALVSDRDPVWPHNGVIEKLVFGDVEGARWYLRRLVHINEGYAKPGFAAYGLTPLISDSIVRKYQSDLYENILG